MSGNLTAEQLRRIEENRKKALAKRAQASASQNHAATHVNFINHSTETSKILNTGPSLDVNKTRYVGPGSSIYSNQDNKVLASKGTSHLNTISEKSSSIEQKKTFADSKTSSNAVASKTFADSKTSSNAVASKTFADSKTSSNAVASKTTIHLPERQKTEFSKVTITTSSDSTEGKSHSYSVKTNNQHDRYTSESSKTGIDFDKIEQNRLKALAKRAEKLTKSPVKSSNTLSDNQSVAADSSTSQSSWLSKNSERVAQSTVLSDSNVTVKQGSQMSSNAGQNIFQGFSGTPVKGGCFLVSRDRFEVKVGYCPVLLQLFKTMETKLYDAVTKKWSFSLSEYNKFMAAVKHLKADIDPLPKAILTTFSAQLRGENPPQHVPIADLSRVEHSLVTSLMPFQREGVNFGIHKNGRVLIADDMGLGKTIQSICLACYYKNEWPLLVVVPSSVRFDWAQNFQRWVPSLDPQSVNVVTTGKDSCTSGRINILSYDLMARQATALKNKKFQIVIMDECHLLKNFKTARCKAAMPILQNARRVLLLSGTPALSRPSELYTQIIAVSPFLFGSFHDFGVRYCDGKQLPWGWDYSGSSNMEELQILLAEKIMIRRLKKDVLTELPDKIRQMILLDPSSIKIDKELKQASKVMASGNLKKMEERGALLDFFHKSGSAKMKAIKSYVEDLLESEKKFLIFAHHGDVLDGIEETVKAKIKNEYIRIDGKTLSEQRNIFCEKFQVNEDIKVAILSITAANAGLNLSSANLVVFAELFWNPGILVQAEDRAHRIGQQDMVSVQYLVAKGTSDDHIWPMIQKKLDVLGKAGLSKDNFSSAETTRLTDQRQEEITKFLEESFCDESFCDNAGGDNPTSEGQSEFNTSPKKGLKQPSILKYTSPLKSLTDSTSCNTTPPKQKKPQGLFKYFSPEKNQNSKTYMDSNGANSKDSDLQGHISEGDDLEEFLNGSDEWDDNIEPVVKKRKT